MRVSLDLPAEDDQLIHAESRASEFWAEDQRLGYLPHPMSWVVKVTPLPPTNTLRVTSAIAQLEADFFRGKEPNAVVANREGQEAANARLIRCASTLQCALEAKVWLDHILEADAHHITEILSTAVLCLSGSGAMATAEASSPMESWRSMD